LLGKKTRGLRRVVHLMSENGTLGGVALILTHRNQAAKSCGTALSTIRAKPEKAVLFGQEERSGFANFD
jgi:hypothetical protein